MPATPYPTVSARLGRIEFSIPLFSFISSQACPPLDGHLSCGPRAHCLRPLSTTDVGERVSKGQRTRHKYACTVDGSSWIYPKRQLSASRRPVSRCLHSVDYPSDVVSGTWSHELQGHLRHKYVVVVSTFRTSFSSVTTLSCI